MSYYGFYDSEIDYVICVNCKEETFSWLAEMFRCTTCDRTEFVTPTGLHAGLAQDEVEGDAEDTSMAIASTIGKRKRRESEDDIVRE